MQGRGSQGGTLLRHINDFCILKMFCRQMWQTFNDFQQRWQLPACPVSLCWLPAKRIYLSLPLSPSLTVSVSVSVDDSRLPRTRLQLKCTANCFFVCLLQTNLTKFAKITWAECTHAEISSLKRERGMGGGDFIDSFVATSAGHMANGKRHHKATLKCRNNLNNSKNFEDGFQTHFGCAV